MLGFEACDAAEVVDQILANGRDVLDHRDVVLLELGSWTNAAELEQFWKIKPISNSDRGRHIMLVSDLLGVSYAPAEMMTSRLANT